MPICEAEIGKWINIINKLQTLQIQTGDINHDVCHPETLTYFTYFYNVSIYLNSKHKIVEIFLCYLIQSRVWAGHCSLSGGHQVKHNCNCSSCRGAGSPSRIKLLKIKFDHNNRWRCNWAEILAARNTVEGCISPQLHPLSLQQYFTL